MYQTIVFDLDGTLIDTLDDLMDAVNYVLTKKCYPKRNKEEIRTFVGNGLKCLLKRSLPETFEEKEFEKLFLDFKDYYAGHCNIKTKPYQGIMELLEKLKKNGYQMAIVSNKNDMAVKELAEYYFPNYFKIAIGEREGIKRKPSPDAVFESMKVMNAKKESTIYVGDSEIDKQTADRALLNCVLVSWGFRKREDLERLHATSLIDDPLQLLEVIN